MVNIVELFSGIGGMHYSLKGTNIPFNVVAAVDINTSANEIYKHNFPETLVLQRNVQSLTCDEYTKLGVNMITMSPPCQPFTRVGLKKDDSDDRTNALIHIIELWPNLSTVNYLLLENVQGFETSNSRESLLKVLQECDFIFQEFLLNPTEYFIPCSRLRYYLLGKRKPLQFSFNSGELMKYIPMSENRILDICSRKGLTPKTAVSCTQEKSDYPYTISEVLESDRDLMQYRVPMKILKKYSGVLDITFPFSRRCCCFTRAYGRYAEGTGSVLCPLSTEEEAHDLLKRMDALRVDSGNNNYKMNEGLSELLDEAEVRYFTPREVARLMCFPEEFTWPKSFSALQLYKLLGNSINVRIVTLMSTLLFDGE